VSVLAVGFGPGVGVAALTGRLPDGVIGGIDPPAVMVQQARRRNRECSRDRPGHVGTRHRGLDSVAGPDLYRCPRRQLHELWDPLDASIKEVVRVLAPAGRLVAGTHVWTIEKRAPLQQWVSDTTELLERAGLDDVAHRIASFRSGEGLVVRAEKRRPCNRKAP
jgi:SAM-dependent methyltransferase